MFVEKCGKTEVSRGELREEEKKFIGFPGGKSIASQWRQQEQGEQREQVEPIRRPGDAAIPVVP